MPDRIDPAALTGQEDLATPPGFGRLWLAVGMVFLAGLISVAGALFIIELYRRLIPSGSLPTLVAAFSAVAGLMLLQGWVRYAAGMMADRAGSEIYFWKQASEGAEKAETFLPLLRALRGRAFPAAADLTWVPVFFLIAGYIHVAFAILAVTFAALFLRFGRSEPERRQARPDEAARERERRRRASVTTLRDLAQVSLLALGGALAMRGVVNVGELVGATMLSMRALAAVQAAAEERFGILEAWKARHAY